MNEYIKSVDSLLANEKPQSSKPSIFEKVMIGVVTTAIGVAGIVSLFEVTADVRKNNAEANKIQNDYNQGWISTNYFQVNNSIEKAKKLCARTAIDPRDMDFGGNISAGQYKKVEKIAREKPVDTNFYSY